MKNIVLKQVKVRHMVVLQEELGTYAEGFKEYLAKPQETTDFMYSVSQVDIASVLWLMFRKKIEVNKVVKTLTLKPSEAVALFNACSNSSVISDDSHTIHVCMMYMNELDEQIKSSYVPTGSDSDRSLKKMVDGS